MIHNADTLFIMSDFDNSTINLYTSGEYSLLKKMGGEGRGPGEFHGVKDFSAYNERIYAPVNPSIMHVFDVNTGYLNSIDLPSNILPAGKFIVLNDEITLFQRYSDFPFLRIDSEGEKLHEFGRWVGGYDDPREEFANNVSHLLYNEEDESIIRVLMSKPLIEFYSYDGDFITSINYEDEELISDRLNQIRREHSENASSRSSTMLLVDDAILIDGKIGLLVHGKSDRFRDILTIDTSKNESEKFKRYIFDVDDFTSLNSIEFISANLIVAYSFESESIFEIELDD